MVYIIFCHLRDSSNLLNTSDAIILKDAFTRAVLQLRQLRNIFFEACKLNWSVKLENTSMRTSIMKLTDEK